MPLFAIVANNGKSIATFDCYYRNRDGVDAMVIYGKDGNLNRRFDLKDFSPFPIEVYEFTMSQLLWRCGTKFNNNHEIEICFKRPDDKTKTIKYNTKTQSLK